MIATDGSLTYTGHTPPLVPEIRGSAAMLSKASPIDVQVQGLVVQATRQIGRKASLYGSGPRNVLMAHTVTTISVRQMFASAPGELL